MIKNIFCEGITKLATPILQFGYSDRGRSCIKVAEVAGKVVGTVVVTTLAVLDGLPAGSEYNAPYQHPDS